VSINQSAVSMAWAKRNPDKFKAIQSRYRAKNLQANSERQRAYYQANRETILAAQRARRAAAREKRDD
jgi:hypothetical protein